MPDVPPRLFLLRVCVVEHRVTIGVIHHFISNLAETSKHDALRLAAVKTYHDSRKLQDNGKTRIHLPGGLEGAPYQQRCALSGQEGLLLP